MKDLVLEPVNGSPRVVWRIINGHPVPYTFTVQRNGNTVTLGELAHHVTTRTPVGEWLENGARDARIQIDIVLQCAREGKNAPAYVRY